jgi:dipeptidyl aminopeptidase/acylaminoacyl peptidase
MTCFRNRTVAALTGLLLAGAAFAADQPAAKTAGSGVTLEMIMAHPDWVARSPENPYWADDGRAVYFQQKRKGEELRDLYRLDLQTRAVRKVEDAERGKADAAGGSWSKDRKWKVYSRQGDVYLKNVETGALRQLTRTGEAEVDARFMAGDKRVAFRRGESIYIYDIASGLISQAADVRLEDDPAVEKDPTYLEEQQIRLLEVIRERKEREEAQRNAQRAEQQADPTRAPLPWYLGKDVQVVTRAFSPSGQWLLLVTTPRSLDEGTPAIMPQYVTRSGNVDTREVRPKVGSPKPYTPKLVLLDLANRQRHDLDFTVLPGIYDDPVKELREAAEARKKARAADKAAGKGAEAGDPAGSATPETPEKAENTAEKKDDAKPAARDLELMGFAWSDDGKNLAIQVEAWDHKDRWLATVDLATGKLVPRHRLTDPGWINWELNEFGWLPDNRTLFLLSEETGYSHLYVVPATADGQARALTQGKFEVSQPVPDQTGRYIYHRANAGHPGIFEVWRTEVATGKSEQLTRMGGVVEGFAVSPDEKRLLVRQSASLRPAELFLLDARPGSEPRRLTETVTPEYLAQDWTAPEIIPVPSSKVKEPIYSKLYTPKGFDPNRAEKYPAVIFIHGAGYTQNSHLGFPYYFREQMFHTLLNQHGYVVLDMDYRASAGYGRDWRTAIYRQMGHPEVEDLQDGIDWLAQHRNVDTSRIGAYGGSYGGFLVFMAMFRKPEMIAAGAAMRPVSDWAHYDHWYTSRILNTPELDPEAYERSSPIEFAEGLQKPLLLCSPMVDDNVFFQDSVRLVQRLIELEKQDFEIAIYPVESHGFVEPSSWLDEYRRIFKLFENNLK